MDHIRWKNSLKKSPFLRGAIRNTSIFLALMAIRPLKVWPFRNNFSCRRLWDDLKGHSRSSKVISWSFKVIDRSKIGTGAIRNTSIFLPVMAIRHLKVWPFRNNFSCQRLWEDLKGHSRSFHGYSLSLAKSGVGLLGTREKIFTTFYEYRFKNAFQLPLVL